ncbi:hypothetical protein WJ973_25345 [Achromobacter xylosoxidans]
MNDSSSNSTQTVWCPYLGSDVALSDCNREHIIPLSLGGSNQFTVPVSRAANSTIGSSVDAALSDKDFFVLQRRREYDARGHNNKEPIVRMRNASYGNLGELDAKGDEVRRPAQVTFKGKDGMTVWDARDRRELTDSDLSDKQIQVKFAIDVFSRMRFVAKVALSAGYEIYGDLFRRTADHNSLRGVMNARDMKTAAEVLKSSQLRGCFEFLPVDEASALTTEAVIKVLSTVSGSIVWTGLSDSSIVFNVGILGTWIGSINVPAETTAYPLMDLHDLGHAVLLVNGQTERISARTLIGRALNFPPGSSSPQSPVPQNDIPSESSEG